MIRMLLFISLFIALLSTLFLYQRVDSLNVEDSLEQASKEPISAATLGLDKDAENKKIDDVAGNTIEAPRLKGVTKPSKLDASTDSTPEEELSAIIKTANPEAVMQYYAEQRYQRAQQLITTMSNEVPDQDWSDTLTKGFSNAKALVPFIGAIELTGSDCRQTICALELDHSELPSYKAAKPFVDKIGIILGVDAFVHHDAYPDKAVIYLSRPQAKLPEA